MNNMPCMFTDSVKTAIYLDCVGILLVMLINQNSERWSSSKVKSSTSHQRDREW